KYYGRTEQELPRETELFRHGGPGQRLKQARVILSALEHRLPGRLQLPAGKERDRQAANGGVVGPAHDPRQRPGIVGAQETKIIPESFTLPDWLSGPAV